MFKSILRLLLRAIFRVEITGQEVLKTIPERTLVVANHTSFLDAVLLYAFLPLNATFAINTYVANSWLGRWAACFCELFAMDPTNPLSIRALIRRVEEGGCVVIFPEGRITVTGALMKVYSGPGLVADRAQATVLPIRIDGAQFSLFSRLKGRVRRRLFPKVTLNVQPLRRLNIDAESRGRARREQAGKELAELMTQLMFDTTPQHLTLVDRLLDARHIHGGDHLIAEDTQRAPLSYNALITRSLLIGRRLAAQSQQDEAVGLLLPTALGTVVTFWGLQLFGRVPAMLNYTAGAKGMIAACETAQLKRVVTSRLFVQKAGLEASVEKLAAQVAVVYLEDITAQLTTGEKLCAWVQARFDPWLRSLSQRQADHRAVILFTSGSEGVPKGVVLSHRNLLANVGQLTSTIDFSAQDIVLNVLPLFHSFGLTGGMLLPLTSGMRAFYYPSPLHYRVIPEVAYDINATILFGTNTFLARYARVAHPYDFYSLRYVFAGAEKLQSEVRTLWEEKFGVRIFEGYGATETSPVIAANTPLAHRAGSVGRLMPGIESRLEAVPGIDNGGQLFVRGPNVMLGHLLHDQPGKLVAPSSSMGDGWYDTGDIVTIDSEGFVTISGRVKRFAKVAGEMVSLTSVEEMAVKVWPQAQHAALAISDASKGEQIVLLTTEEDAVRATLVASAKSEGVTELAVPRRIMVVKSIPLLGSGKTDYVTAAALLAAAS